LDSTPAKEKSDSTNGSKAMYNKPIRLMITPLTTLIRVVSMNMTAQGAGLQHTSGQRSQASLLAKV
jgi:hypothetical protein